MATTLPTLTRTLDDDFVSTWYEIRPDAIDNILDATPFTMALKEMGAMTPQVGGEYITRTIRYGEKSSQNIQKGTVLSQSEPKLETMARWDWKYDAVDVNRTVIDEQKNAGKFKIKDYIATRLGAARDALVQDAEAHLMRSSLADTTGKQLNGLYDLVPPYSSQLSNLYTTHSVDPDDYNTAASGRSGNISRANAWWQCKYGNSGTAVANYAVNLVPEMRSMWNDVTSNLESPNLIIMNRDLFEAYEDEVADRQQIVRTAFDKKAADLGFETFTFKGATVMWTDELDGSSYRDLFMLNTNYIELVYDPNLWFDMTEWKSTSNQLERVAYIVRAWQLITTSPRRHGLLTFSS
jgi:hypothetical protein